MKKYISGLVTGVVLALSLSTFAAVQLNVVPNPYPVLINGTETEVDGYNINGSTYLKISDFKSAGLTAEFNKQDKQIQLNSTEGSANQVATTTETEFKDYTVPELDQTSKLNPTALFDGDNFELAAYGKYNAIKYNDNFYISCIDSKIIGKFNSKNTNMKLYKNKELILETLDATPTYYIYCNDKLYFNVLFVGKYLEN